MEYFIYTACINGESKINISSNPRIDFTILQNILDTASIEVLTPPLSISQADYIMKALNRKHRFFEKLPVLRSKRYGNLKADTFERLLMSLNINPLRRARIIDKGDALPVDSDLKSIHDILEGRILTMDGINEAMKKNRQHIASPAGDILQVLYLKDKLDIYPSLVIDEPYGETRCRTCGSRIDYTDSDSRCKVCGSVAESSEPLFALTYRGINAAIGPMKYREFRDMSIPQAAASAKLCTFLGSNRDECLLWTIRGAENINIAARAIKDTLYRGGRCACLSPSIKEGMKLCSSLKRIFPSSECTLLNEYHTEAGKDIVVCNFEDIVSFYRSFDLVIINEVSGDAKKFPEYLLHPARESLTSRGKIIYATSTPDYQLYRRALKGDTYLVTVPIRSWGKPSPEPRVITYKISEGGCSFIPKEIIEFIIWSLRKKIPVHIVVPSSDCVKLLEDGLISNRRIKQDWVEGPDRRINITIPSDEASRRTGENVLVYFADDSSVFDEKALLDAAGLSGETNTGPGQVIFVGSRENDKMYNARMMLRYINKQAWEMGYLK